MSWKSWEVQAREERAKLWLSTERDGLSRLKSSPERSPTVSYSSRDLLLGTQVQIPIHPSNCLITSLKLDKNRKALLERKKRVSKDKNKHKEGLADLGWAHSVQHPSITVVAN
jgi:hypothetical protein